MKGYGLPRNHDVGSPDVADLGLYGLKPSCGYLRKKGGDFIGQDPIKKAKARRVWKKKARKDAKNDIQNELK